MRRDIPIGLFVAGVQVKQISDTGVVGMFAFFDGWDEIGTAVIQSSFPFGPVRVFALNK